MVLESHFEDPEHCPVCVESTKTRPDPTPGRWNPTSIAALAVLLNPAFVITFFALARSREWLRFADARDAQGSYGPWHPHIRTNAMWAIAISAFQPLVAFFIVAGIFLAADVDRPRPEPFDERAEILSLLEHAKPAVRALALCQLDEIRPQPEDATAIATALRRELPTLGIACGELAFADASGRPVAERYARQSVDVRDALLTRLSRRDLPLEAPTLLLQEMELNPVARAGIDSFSTVVVVTPDDALVSTFLRLAANDTTRVAAYRPLATMCAREPRIARWVSMHSDDVPEDAVPRECKVAP